MRLNSVWQWKEERASGGRQSCSTWGKGTWKGHTDSRTQYNGLFFISMRMSNELGLNMHLPFTEGFFFNFRKLRNFNHHWSITFKKRKTQRRWPSIWVPTTDSDGQGSEEADFWPAHPIVFIHSATPPVNTSQAIVYSFCFNILKTLI